MRLYSVAVLLVVLSVALVCSEKLLGHRTRTNFPKPWAVGKQALPTEEVFFIVALKQQNLDVLENKFWAVSTPGSPDYRNFLSIEEIASIVAPPAEHTQAVVNWLVSNGVSRSLIENHADSLRVKTTTSVASKLFNTDFHYFHHQVTDKTIIRQLGRFSIPDEVAEYIDFVSGLSEFPVPRYTLKKSPNAAVTIAPQSLSAIYMIPPTAKITGNSSAGPIEWEDQYFSPDDLNNFNTNFALQIPAVKSNHIVGFNDPTSPQLEATLDIQYILAVPPSVDSWFWIEKDGVWLYGWATHFFSTNDVPLICSISYGWNEEAQCQAGIGDQECQQLGVDSKGYVTRVNTEFQKIGLRGVSLLSASGDSGANGRTDPDCTENHLNPPYPAASPYITAVGATQITDASGQANLPNPPPGCSGQNCASGGSEAAVSYTQAQFASGGGFSVYADRPGYQAAAVGKYLSSAVKLPPSSYYNAAGRGFPDVAALGSAILIYQSQIETVGGTSASCPIFAGVMALLNDYVNTKTGKPLGFLNPFLYQMAASSTTTFTDITVGDNICTEDGCSSGCQGFYAAQGWDPVTGLGTPVYSEMLKYVQKFFDIKDE